MTNQVYKVIKTLDQISPDKRNSLTRACKKLLESLQVGQTIESARFVQEQIPKISSAKEPVNIACIGYRYLRDGKRIGMLAEKTEQKPTLPFDHQLN